MLKTTKSSTKFYKIIDISLKSFAIEFQSKTNYQSIQCIYLRL